MFVLRIIIVVSFGMLSVTLSNSQQAERFLCQDSACTDSAKGLYPGESVENQKNDEYIKQTNYSELYFIVAAVVTLLFTFIYYKHQRETYENYLLTLLAAKDHSLLIVQKELSLFKEEEHRINAPTLERNSEIKTMSLRLNKSEDIISSQALHIKILESEKKELTNIGMEMHTLLSSLFESHLKSTEKLNTINGKLVDSENTVAALTQEINTKSILRESKLLDEINSLQYELDKQTNSLIAAENEVSLFKETLRKIDSEETESFLWGIKLSSEIEIANQTCEMYKQAMGVVLKSNGEYLDHIDTLKCNIINLKDNVSELEGEKEESKNKLNIITKLFKKQEKEYQKYVPRKKFKGWWE